MKPKFIKEWDPVLPQDVLVYTSEKWFMEADDYTYMLFQRNKALEEENAGIRATRDKMHDHIRELEHRIHELELELEEERERSAKLRWRAQVPNKPVGEDWRPLMNWFLNLNKDEE